MVPGLWVYAIARAGHAPPRNVEAIDGSNNIEAVDDGQLSAFFTPVDLRDYSQQAVDAHAKDVEWLGAIGYRHQAVMQALMHGGGIIPLRAFSLFGSTQMIEAQLRTGRDQFVKVLDRLEGKQEWTLRIEFEPERWNNALANRVDTLKDLTAQIESSAPGKAFLLRKKFDDEKKRASKTAETQVVAEIEKTIMDKLRCETVSETRQQRDGAFPQINVLVNRDEEAILQELHGELTRRYEAEGIAVAITGPWPPYTFATTQ